MLRIVIVDRGELAGRLFLGALCLVGILLTNCSAKENAPSPSEDRLPHAVTVDPPEGSVLLSANIRAGDALGAVLLPKMSSAGGILTTTMVDLEDLDRSSALGRVSMQQVGSRLSQHGFKVLESRLSSSLRFEKREGEFMLTRDSLLLLSNSYDAHAVLVGAYAQSRDKVFFSARVVRLHDGALLAAYEYYLPRSGDVQALLLGRHMGDLQAVDNDLWLRYARREPAFAAGRTSP